MPGRDDGQREFLDVEALAGELLDPGSVFAFLAEHRGRLIPPLMFEDLFPSGLQALNGLSDGEAAEAVAFDLRWKAACRFAVTTKAFHPTTLTY